MAVAKTSLSWTVDGPASLDLDLVVFLIGYEGKLNHDEDFIYYKNLRGRGSAVLHSGDDRKGGKSRDCESVTIDFDRIPPDIERVLICVAAYDDPDRAKMRFGMADRALVSVCRDEEGRNEFTEVISFDLSGEFAEESAMITCEINRAERGWKFVAEGSAAGSLRDLCERFGLEVLN
jgi:tellurium resistance protein TerD